MAYQPKSYRKFVATAATATLVASAVTPAFAAEFIDVNSNYKEAVDYLVEQEIAKGKSDTTFGTVDPITRGDAAIMIANALNLDTETAPDAGFVDLNSRVDGAVNALAAAGIVSGKTATEFKPEEKITRQETAKIMTIAFELEAGNLNNSFSDVNENWDPYVNALVANEIAFGKTADIFAPYDNVTRGEFALFMFREAGSEESGSLLDLPAGSYVIQEDTLLDTWTIVLRQDQLPADLKGADSYTLTLEDGTEVTLNQNQFDENVFNGSVSSTTYTKEEVEAGILTPVLPASETLSELPGGSYVIQKDTLLDTWTIVLRQDQLPADLQAATGYVLTLEDGTEVTLNQNQFDENVFNGSVSSTAHTEAEVEAGVVTAN